MEPSVHGQSAKKKNNLFKTVQLQNKNKVDK